MAFSGQPSFVAMCICDNGELELTAVWSVGSMVLWSFVLVEALGLMPTLSRMVKRIQIQLAMRV